MEFRKIIENVINSKTLVICDVQPAHSKAITFDMRDFCHFAMTYPKVVVLYNGPDFGFENSIEIAKWYKSFGVPVETLRSWKWFQKNYAWFRDMMDDGCYARGSLVKLARYMIRKRIWDWRELEEEDFKILNIPDISGDIAERFSFCIPDLVFKLKSVNGADICGGGVNECLDEVMILAEALNVNLNIIHEWTY